MKIGLVGRLLGLTFVLYAAGLLLSFAYVNSESSRAAEREAREDLQVRLSLSLSSVEAELQAGQISDAFLRQLGEKSQTRATVYSLDGVALFDSKLSSGELGSHPFTQESPEIHQARNLRKAGPTGYASHRGEEGLSVAGTAFQRGSPALVLRLSHSNTELAGRIETRAPPLLPAMLGLLLAFCVAWVLARPMTQPIATLARAAARMAKGDLESRTRLVRGDELGELGITLDHLAENLSSTLNALKSERDHLQGILGAMEEGVLFLDDAGRVRLVNPALREMLLIAGDSAGKSLLEVVRHADLKEMLDVAREEDDDELGGGGVSGEIRTTGLKPRQLLVRAKRLSGPERGVVAIFLDVTETRRLENLRTEFVANVSHELRTPVTSIRSAAETLAISGGTLPKMAEKFVGIIERNAARLQSLVEDLLDLSRIESRQFSLTPTPLMPLTILAHVEGLFSERAERRRIRIVLDSSSDVAELQGDRRALEHIFSNLVDNAIKYAREDSEVVLSAKNYGADKVELSVADSGPGIEDKHLGRLFERFYRVDAGRSRDMGGTGLGLSIVKHLVESMGGNVTVESELGVGTRFLVRMPRATKGPAVGRESLN